MIWLYTDTCNSIEDVDISEYMIQCICSDVWFAVSMRTSACVSRCIHVIYIYIHTYLHVMCVNPDVIHTGASL